MSACFICEFPLEGRCLTVNTVKEKGIASFIEASKKRKDGKGSCLKGQTSVRVHDKCRKSYTDERSIIAFLKKSEELLTAKPHLTRSVGARFSFRSHCFICGLEITNSFLVAENKNHQVNGMLCM